EVEEDDVGEILLGGGQRRGAVGRLGRLEPFGLEQGPDHTADVGLVVDEQDARAHVANTMVNVAPPPGVSSTVMVARWASIVWRTNASPSPVPSARSEERRVGKE